MLTKKHLALFFCLLATPVVAHSWYPWECCSAYDCAPLASSSVRIGANGYAVVIAPGTHPQWGKERPGPLMLTVPFKDAKPSQDDKFHICLNAKGDFLCFFQVIGGV